MQQEDNKWIWGPTPLFPGAAKVAPALILPWHGCLNCHLGNKDGVRAILYVYNPLNLPSGR